MAATKVGENALPEWSDDEGIDFYKTRGVP